jgi:hypothetical protein
MTPAHWFALLHPVLMILFVYPVVGATIRLGILVREQRLGITQQPALVPVEHADHGRWVTSGTVVAVLIALVWSYGVHAVPVARLLPLLAVAAGCLGSCLALWRVKAPGLRAAFALLCWFALLALGLQPEVWRLSDNPLGSAFWGSHYWSGWLLCGLLLFGMAAKPEIASSLRLRRLHVSAAVLMAVLLAVQAITGSRDLWQMGAGG